MQSLFAHFAARLRYTARWILPVTVLYCSIFVHIPPAQAGSPGPRLFLPIIRDGNAAAPQQPIAAWLEMLNAYRIPAGLPAVSENPDWSAACALHARYAVINDELSHSENPSKPGYTSAGNEAAQSSNLYASSDLYARDETALAGWMQGPFHALGILDPALQTAGYGSYREAGGTLAMAACLDVLRGRTAPPENAYPVLWPAAESQVNLTTHRSEYPNPLASCPGYQSPSGLPVIVQFGAGALAPQVSTHAFRQDGQELEHCVFTESTYANPDPAAQDLGRAILDQHDAVVLIPRRPLLAGQAYQVSLTVNGVKLDWSFSTAP